MKTEYTENGGCLQRDSVEHKEYAEAYSTERRKTEEKDGADLLCKVLDRDNLNRAYKRVKANKGASGTDGMTVEEALPWLKENGEELLEKIRNGRYKPSPVRRVEIPKDNGGVRKLGIPTVIDRIIQQAIAQVLIPIYEPKFSDGSYGYRPHRSAKDTMLSSTANESCREKPVFIGVIYSKFYYTIDKTGNRCYYKNKNRCSRQPSL